MVYEIRCSWCGILIGTKEKEENEFAVAMKIEGFLYPTRYAQIAKKPCQKNMD